MTYRPDIDGLRGLAVALVFLYHARPELMPGGYVGVDIFFVISGFLIIRLLVDDIERGVFRFAIFIERRMRRILPALIVVTIATAIAGYFILGAADYRRLGQSVLALSFAAPNVYFWRGDDYFGRSLPEQPLLHTWSLGVEEQFYLTVPLFLLVVSGLSSKARLTWLTLGLTGSLFLCLLWTGSHPVASFYLLPTRAWEMLLGGLVAFAAPATKWSDSPFQVVAAIGLAAIAAAAMCFNSVTQYPGLAAMLPCVGTAAIIWACAARRTVAGAVLGNRLLVKLGLVSYSLYLWHWPAFALLRYVLDREPDAIELLATSIAIVFLAYFTWRFVETPFRSRLALPSPRGWWLGASTALVAVAACGLGIIGANGFPGRMPAAALAYEETARDRPPDTARCHHGLPSLVALDDLCIFNPQSPQTVLVWGDSHANALMPPLQELTADYGLRLLQASYSACPPLLGVDVAYMPASHRCREFNELILAAIEHFGIDKVILSASWFAYFGTDLESRFSAAFDIYSAKQALGGPEAERQQIFAHALGETVRQLQARGVEVWIVRPVPLQPRFVANSLARAVVQQRDPEDVGISLSQHRLNQARIETIFATLPAATQFIDPAVPLCRTGVCRAGADGMSFYIDTNHLSVHGAMLLTEVLRPAIEGQASLRQTSE